jgi:hypothetical protein
MPRTTEHRAVGPEAASPMAVGEALVHGVLGHWVLSFEYQGLRRTVEPHLVGVHEAGEAVLLAYQTGGVSYAGELPGWRTFIVSEIDDVELEDREFPGPRPDFAPDSLPMVDIFARA